MSPECISHRPSLRHHHMETGQCDGSDAYGIWEERNPQLANTVCLCVVCFSAMKLTSTGTLLIYFRLCAQQLCLVFRFSSLMYFLLLLTFSRHFVGSIFPLLFPFAWDMFLYILPKSIYTFKNLCMMERYKQAYSKQLVDWKNQFVVGKSQHLISKAQFGIKTGNGNISQTISIWSPNLKLSYKTISSLFNLCKDWNVQAMTLTFKDTGGCRTLPLILWQQHNINISVGGSLSLGKLFNISKGSWLNTNTYNWLVKVPHWVTVPACIFYGNSSITVCEPVGRHAMCEGFKAGCKEQCVLEVWTEQQEDGFNGCLDSGSFLWSSAAHAGTPFSLFPQWTLFWKRATFYKPWQPVHAYSACQFRLTAQE